ncbi:hypothetical protein JCM17380_40790 [Desulfosporosinus burensis]
MITLALTESSSTEVRQLLRNHLEDALNRNEKASNFMANKGWYDAYVNRRILMDYIMLKLF